MIADATITGSRSGARHHRQRPLHLTATVAAHGRSGPYRALDGANKPGRDEANPMTQPKRFVNRRVTLRGAKIDGRGPRAGFRANDSQKYDREITAADLGSARSPHGSNRIPRASNVGGPDFQTSEAGSERPRVAANGNGASPMFVPIRRQARRRSLAADAHAILDLGQIEIAGPKGPLNHPQEPRRQAHEPTRGQQPYIRIGRRRPAGTAGPIPGQGLWPAILAPSSGHHTPSSAWLFERLRSMLSAADSPAIPTDDLGPKPAANPRSGGTWPQK